MPKKISRGVFLASVWLVTIVGYNRKFQSFTWNVQLNLNNITDEVYLNRYRFTDPRTYSVTNRIRF